MTLYNIKKRQNNKSGFTLLEIVCVIAIMGMMAAMVLPVSAKIQRTAKISATQTKLDEVKDAIIGKSGSGGESSGGFAGDTGRLPFLFAVEWNKTDGRWDWQYEQPVNDGTGQPVELWTDIFAKAPDYTSSEWAGPYLASPRDPYPDDTKNISFEADPELFAKKQVEGRLSDAWGRALYFWLDSSEGGLETLHIISAGPDGAVVFSDSVYDKNAKENKDNIIVEIVPREWYWFNSESKSSETRKLISEVREAIIKRQANLLTGYIGDMGAWPELYVWNDRDWQPAAASTVESDGSVMSVTEGYPRGLWIKPGSSLWEGPYLDAPWGKDENEYPTDAWGKALSFRLITIGGTSEPDGQEASEYLEITSGGMDMITGTSDDITVVIHDYEWKKGNLDKNTYEKITRTETLLKNVRAAFLGDGSARDGAGRVMISGYLSDTGAFPEIIETTKPVWLWENPYKGEAPVGFDWKGPYYPNTDAGDTINDAWGNPLIFRLEQDAGMQLLSVISAGPDGKTGSEGENFDADNISVVISRDDWYAEEFAISGTLVNLSPSKTVKTITSTDEYGATVSTSTTEYAPWSVTLRLYTSPDVFIEHTIYSRSKYEPFALDVPSCVCGSRLLVVKTTETEAMPITTEISRIYIQIGAGGTCSPSADRLIIYAGTD